jgi:outer membrane protein assembly factor BamE (lipoprotein component of BamABCDE complex)
MRTGYFTKSVRLLSFFSAISLAAFLSGCFTVGHNFPVDQVAAIKIGKTTQDEVKSMFGSPWRVGMEDGQRTWTYGKYRYSAFAETSTQDLVIRFNDRGVVVSFTFNTTEHQQ